MHQVFEDESLAASLSQRGLERSRDFTWSRTAAAHAAVYRTLADD
jgi:hypothetical protein